MQNTKKTKLEYTVEILKEDNNGSVGSTAIHFATVPNAMPASQEKAPYLVHPVMGATMEIDEFAAAMLKEAGQGTLTEAKYYANVFDEVLEKLLADGKTSVDTGWFSAAPAISGSVPYCNAPLTEENEIYIALLPCLDTRKLVAMMETASSASDRAFDIKEVFDVATNKPGIVAGDPFYVFGQSFSDDMTATLVDAAGVEHPCTDAVVDRIPTRLKFTAPEEIAEGKCTLAITGVGSGEEPVTQKKPNVMVKSEWTPTPPEPAPTVVISKVKTGSVDGKIVLDEDAFEIVGEHLEKLEGDTLKVKGTSDQGAPVEYVIPYATFACNADGTQLTVQITEAMRDAFYSGWTWDEVTLEYTSHAGVAGSAAQVTTGTAEVVNE